MYKLRGSKHFDFIAFADGNNIHYGKPLVLAMKTKRS
jgi:hypothetical protein